MIMNRIIQLFDSDKRDDWVNLSLDNEYASQNGTWKALEPGLLVISSGDFRSREWGLDLLGQNRYGEALVARLLGFWHVTGIHCKSSGKAQIAEGNQLDDTDNGLWEQWS